MRMIISGLPYFARRLAMRLSDFDRGNIYIAINPGKGLWSRIRYIYHLIRADAIYSIGGFVVSSKAAVLALFLRKRLVMHWVGSDVLNAKKAYREGLASRKVMDGTVHFCEAEWIRDELKEIGIKAEIVYYAGFDRKDAPIYKLPGKFSILSYVAQNREQFYGMEQLIRLACDFPDIEIRIAGMSFSRKELPPNIRLLSWVDSMEEQYKGCVLFLRLMEHDGLSFSVREALANGRYVGYSCKYDGTFYIPDYPALKRVVSGLYDRFRNHLLPVNDEGIAFVRKNFNERSILENLVKKLQEGIQLCARS